MAALQQKQKQQQPTIREESPNKTRENTYYEINNENQKKKSKEIDNIKDYDDDDDKLNKNTLKAFLSESLMYDPKQKRRNLAEDYEKPVSERESWWRVTIKETPQPHAYETTNYSFLTDLLKKPGTYRFKSDGRKLHPTPQIGRGEYLMPGAYDFEDLSTRLTKTITTYGFRGPERDSLMEKSLLGFHYDKEYNVSPNSYQTEKVNQIYCDPEPAKHGAFKSRTKRKVFRPKEGPPPGAYEPEKPKSAVTISSCFKSKSSRFVKSQTITPGPGSYWPLKNWPVSKDVEKMGEKGVFFTPNFKTVT